MSANRKERQDQDGPRAVPWAPVLSLQASEPLGLALNSRLSGALSQVSLSLLVRTLGRSKGLRGEGARLGQPDSDNLTLRTRQTD